MVIGPTDRRRIDSFLQMHSRSAKLGKPEQSITH
jgi:hypothetical protein